MMREPTNKEIDSACMSYRHDFGLMNIAEANALRRAAKAWLRAWQKEAEAMAPDEIEIYRIIKSSGARRHVDIAKAVAKYLAPKGGKE